jgi:branched-chain amino acid transport system ATP-binding protein
MTHVSQFHQRFGRAIVGIEPLVGIFVKGADNKSRKSWFPELAEVKKSRAGILSGGQRQMFSLAMVTLRKPALLLLDEPSAGLAPKLVDRLMAKIEELNREHGMTMLLVEQNIRRALAISRRAYSLRAGVIANEHLEPSRLTEQESFEAILQA